jgi:hypothetical protein
MRSVAVVDGCLALAGLLGRRRWRELAAARLRIGLRARRLRIVVALAAQ